MGSVGQNQIARSPDGASFLRTWANKINADREKRQKELFAVFTRASGFVKMGVLDEYSMIQYTYTLIFDIVQ